MPVYEYKCLRCKKKFEKLIFGSNNRVSCPECNSEDVEKQMSLVGFKVEKSTGQNNSRLSSGASCASCSSHNCSQCH